MKNKLSLTPYFKTQYKRLAKKFASLENDMDELVATLLEDPTHGKPLGSGLYKVRLAVASKSSGKSGGFRVITYIVETTKDGTRIRLVTLYDKSEKDSISKKELLKIVADSLKKGN